MSAPARAGWPAPPPASIPNPDTNQTRATPALPPLPSCTLKPEDYPWQRPAAFSEAIERAGQMMAWGELSDAGLEDFIRYLSRAIPVKERGDQVAHMLTQARWYRDREEQRHYDAEMAVVRYVRDALKWSHDPDEILAQALTLAGDALSEADVLALLRGCSIDHAERLKRLTMVPKGARR